MALDDPVLVRWCTMRQTPFLRPLNPLMLRAGPLAAGAALSLLLATPIGAATPLTGITQAVPQTAQAATKPVANVAANVTQPVKTTVNTAAAASQPVANTAPVVQRVGGSAGPVVAQTTAPVTKAVAPATQQVGAAAQPVVNAVVQPAASAAAPVVQPVAQIAGGATLPVAQVTTPVVQAAAPVSQVAAPVVQQVSAAVQPAATVVAPVAQAVAPAAQAVPVAPVVSPVTQQAAAVIQPVAKVTAPPAQVAPPVTQPARVAAPVAQPVAQVAARRPQAAAPAAIEQVPPIVFPTINLSMSPAVATANPSAISSAPATEISTTAVPHAILDVGGSVAQFAPVSRAEQRMSVVVFPAPASNPTGHETSLTALAAPSSVSQLVCVGGLYVDVTFNVPTGRPCQIAEQVGGEPLSAPTNGVAAATQPAALPTPQTATGSNGLATTVATIIQNVRNGLVSLPQTGTAQWLRSETLVPLPLILGSLLMLAGFVLRRRSGVARFRFSAIN